MDSPGGFVSTTQIELDQGLLDQAATILGTKTKKATVNEALRRVVQEELRRRHVDELAGGALPDLADPAVMDSAWR
jgi:Arc/MetJ family transcription regulator